MTFFTNSLSKTQPLQQTSQPRNNIKLLSLFSFFVLLWPSCIQAEERERDPETIPPTVLESLTISPNVALEPLTFPPTSGDSGLIENGDFDAMDNSTETPTSGTNVTNSTQSTLGNLTTSSESEPDPPEPEPEPEPEIYWEGCVDPTNPAKSHNLIKQNKKTTVCVVISGGGNWGAEGMKYQRVTFQPTADEYSHFHIDYSYIDLVVKPKTKDFLPHVSVHVATQQKMSFIKRYYDQKKQKVYPFLTAIINVNEGEVIGVSWDDACLFCGLGECEENTYDFSGNKTDSIPHTKGCYVTKEKCDEDLGKCGLNIYFVWTGTDIDGNPLRSYNSRFSAFPPNIIPKLTDAVVDATNDAIDTVTDATNDAIDTVVDTVSDIGDTVSNATNVVVDTASNIAETVGNATESVASTVSSVADNVRRLIFG